VARETQAQPDLSRDTPDDAISNRTRGRSVPGLRLRRVIGWNLAVLLWVTGSLFSAKGFSPRLNAINPAGIQRGTEAELTFSGERLQDTEEIVSFEPGIEVLKLGAVTNNTVTAAVKITSDCPLGEHHLRLRTRSGLSDLRTIFVSPFPVVQEQEPNNEPAKAQKIALNTTVAGVVLNEDVDCFAVEVKEGQRLSAEVQGMRLGRGAFDPRLEVLDPGGAVIALAADSWLGMQDPIISLKAPKTGTYIIRLREVTYAGNDKCQYLLHIGNFPRPTIVYPLGGKAGETLALKCFSGATGEFEYKVPLPAVPQDRFGVFAELDGMPAPTPNWIRVSRFPNVLAGTGNQDREHATFSEIEPPFALNGVISTLGKEDWFGFRAIKGTALELTVFARRLRSPLDSQLEVFDCNGKSISANDDAIGADSALKFTPAETTNYFVRIKDAMGNGGTEFAYRVEVVPAEPRLEVKIPEVSRNDTQSRQYITVPRGNRFATLISAKRSNFSGDLGFDLASLPAGVKMDADRMPQGVDSMPLVFEAAEDAPIAGKLTDLTATGTNSNGSLVGTFRQDVELVEGPNNTSFYGTSVDKLNVAVTEAAPFKLRIVEPAVPLVQAGSMKLEIVAERSPGFDQPIEVKMVWNPPGISSQSEATIAGSATNLFYQLNAAGNAETRSWRIAALGRATADGGPVYASSQLAKLDVAPPYLSGKIETLWISPGKSGKLVVNLQQAKSFEGNATIRLVGLPEKVNAPEKEITKDAQEVVFDVSVDSACQTGSHKNLSCAVDVRQDGQIIPHSIAAGGILRIVPPRKTDAKAVAAAEKSK
jgi:hypothetical protein